MNCSPAIKAEALTRYYGYLLAVDHVNFEVRQGEIFPRLARHLVSALDRRLSGQAGLARGGRGFGRRGR